jgi:hypothetical protein
VVLSITRNPTKPQLLIFSGLALTPGLRLDIDIAVTMSAALMQRVIDRTIEMVAHLSRHAAAG